jgi:vacuolar-type H+-ATPase subunit H
MESSLRRARDAVQTARELTDDATTREQLDSIDRALEDLSGTDVLDDDTEEGARLEEVERQLVTLGDDTDNPARQQIGRARDHIDAFRRTEARDWE